MNESKAKYRPSLPAHLIAHITELAKREKPLRTESIELIGILAPFQAKVENLAVAPAYTTAPKLSTFESLGGVVADASIPKEVYWSQCYEVWKNDPTSLNLREMQAVYEHRYLHGLMEALEMASYEESTSLVQKQAE